MRIRPLMVLCFGSVLSCFADIYQEAIGPIALDITTGSVYSARIAITNRIEALMRSVSNDCEVASCKLLKASLLLDCAEEDLSSAAYAEVTNLCSDVMSDFSSRNDKWQLYGSSFITMSAYALDGKCHNAIVVATNALSKLDTVSSVDTETNVWNAITRESPFGAMSFRDTFRAGVALGKAVSHETTDIGVYTNGLRSEVIGIIDAMLR